MILGATGSPRLCCAVELFVIAVPACCLSGCLPCPGTLAGCGRGFVVCDPGCLMLVNISTSALRQTKWYEFLSRFALGGLVTAGTGVLAKKLGPSFGGIFLAFPALLVASTTLVERHEQERKQEKGLGRPLSRPTPAGADAAGAAMGSFGLMTFAWWAWKFLPQHRLWLSLAGATLAWWLVAVSVWWLWKRNLPHRLRTALASRPIK